MSSGAPAEPPERNIRLLIEYDGTRFVGWQVQENGPSVQAEILAAIAKVTGEPTAVTVAGRTDAGVHALGQVASFKTRSRIPAERFAPAITSYLPADVAVHRSEEVPKDFDARHSALSKRYRYRVLSSRQRAPLDVHRAWHVRGALDLEAMAAAAQRLVGEHDFESFRSVHCDAPHARRNMLSIAITTAARPPTGRYIDFVFHADAFCRHMCRILAGNLVEVGLEKRTPSDLAAVLEARDRRLAGVTAPPHGLTLLEVKYP